MSSSDDRGKGEWQAMGSAALFWLRQSLAQRSAALIPLALLTFAAFTAALSPQPVRGQAGTTAAPTLTPIPPLDPAKAINVRAFGAVGDGVTSDRMAVQKAIDAAKPGDSIYFPVGTYYLDEPPFVLTSNLTLWGDGPQSVLKGTLGRPAIDLGNNGQPLTGLIVTRLAVLGLPGKYKPDGNGGSGIFIFGPKGTLISDCDFIGCGSPIYNAGVTGTTYGTRVENCRIHGWGNVAIFCNGGEQVIDTQLVQDDPDLKDEHSSHGFYIHSGCTNVLIQNTLIQNCRKYAAQIYGQNVDTTTSNITFLNDTIKDCAHGITIDSGSAQEAHAQHVLIQGCTITGTYNAPAITVQQGDDIQIMNNILDGGSVGLELGNWAPYQTGYSVSNLQASGNTIRNFDTGVWGLASNGGTFTNVVVSGNTITNCKVPVDLSKAPGVTFKP